MDIRALKNPPIKEALLEIRFNPNKKVTISKLKEFADSISDKYTKVDPLEDTSFEFMFPKGKGEKHNFNIEPSGFRLTNTQNNRVVIAAIDKFVVSFLAPYTEWINLKNTAEDLYNKYLALVPQTEIIRLGMRYINSVKFPLTDDFSFQKYINTFQPLPQHKELSNSIAKFETIVAIPHNDINCTSTIRQVVLDAEVDGHRYLPFILDIDVYQDNENKSVQSAEVWSVFEQMRIKKNAIFFSTLTDAAIKPYV